MKNKKIFQGVVLVVMLILPFLVYFIMVYSAEENFFQTLAYAGPKTAETKVVDGKKVTDSVPYQIPQYEFRTQDDTLLSSQEMRGNIYVANFFFTSCPNVCPAMNYNVQQVQNRFKGYDDFKIVSFTVDPEHDTVEVLKKYEKKIGAINGLWYFLTGDQDSIYATARDFFVNAMEEPEAAGGFLHSQYLILVDWKGRIRCRRDENGNPIGVYDGLSVDQVNNLEDDIKVLIAEHEKAQSIERKERQDRLKAENEQSS